MPTHIQLVYLGHIKMQRVNGAFPFASASVDVTNELNGDVLRLFPTVAHVISFKSDVYQQLR